MTKILTTFKKPNKLSLPRFVLTIFLSSVLLNSLLACSTHPTASSTPANEFVRAASKGDVKSIEVFLKSGMPVDTTNAIGTTAAMAAAAKGQLAVLEVLVAHKANLEFTDDSGDNVWSFASTEHQLPTVQFLTDHKLNPNLLVYKDLSPLFIAVLQQQPKIVALLLKAGAQADFLTDSGGPLHSALRVGDLESAKLLIESGAPINRQDPEGETPLMIAASIGMDNVVSLLLKHGAKKNLKDKSGRTARTRALSGGKINTASLLD